MESETIRAFVVRERRARWLDALGSPARRAKFLDRLNHCCDFDPRYATALEANADVVTILVAEGAPATCHIISDSPGLDGQQLSLSQAVFEVEQNGWGTLICCLPGRLAYFHGEDGEERLLLRRANG